ncbi:hypothetical protein [Streptomyces sp. NBC_00557]|uniref:hypothetical protein n=1 Tax=Streptomyces sp. NBC_00557 TaxID=2975776 RepID=UPI002E8045B8|nr:hypothetical protein [Streptomyces sp. NBC_00557]WUC39580.1 hypothetical protein OG956_38055 [Streptomyces sp. NBC_00557]
MPETVMALASTALVLTGQLAKRWIVGRTRVRLAQLYQRGVTERVRQLPPGSVLIERRSENELRIEIGGTGEGSHD